ncbi:hypothetical protein MUP79_06875 [Candidatus Bathyarchaeota archaeon]|nr:hypothetical protein [Candidatus Bathyarchaeota archaeon]
MTRRYDPKLKLRLLRRLKDRPLTFTRWVKKAMLNRQTLNDYRKQLLKEGLIERDPIDRTYALTAKGAAKIMEAEEE